jgi:uncharacterized OsmC-like protein
MSNPTVVTVTRDSGYRFTVDFAPGMATLLVDEPPPLGEGAGPSPSQMLMAAVANCLSASLTFALQKFKQDPGTLQATVTADIGRNEANRLRIQKLNVAIRLGANAADLAHLERVLTQFEEFCTVSMSVREGIPMAVTVFDGTGMQLK